MNREELRALQAPLKEQYRERPEAALVRLRAAGTLGDDVTCSVETGRALVEAGLHPATGGTGMSVCSGDMLLQALVACAGVTLGAVSTPSGSCSATRASGRGRPRLPRDARGQPRGARRLQSIRLTIELDTDASADEQREARVADRALLRGVPDDLARLPGVGRQRAGRVARAKAPA